MLGWTPFPHRGATLAALILPLTLAMALLGAGWDLIGWVIGYGG